MLIAAPSRYPDRCSTWRYCMGLPKLTFFCELDAEPLKALINKPMIRRLQAMHASLSLGIRDMEPDRVEKWLAANSYFRLRLRKDFRLADLPRLSLPRGRWLIESSLLVSIIAFGCFDRLRLCHKAPGRSIRNV